MRTINQLPTGYIIGGHYEILKVLGQGGFGIVYLVKDLHKLGEQLVVKELFAKEFSFRKRESSIVINQSNMIHIFQKIKEDIKKEVTILSKISNPNIVKAYGYFEENETIYSIMEFIDGMDLDLFLKEHGPFTEEETKELLKQFIHGLKPIHKKNIIHRDIKPNNIIRTPEGIYKIIDFSSNKQYVDGKTTTITSYQNPIYTAPELMQKKTIIGEFSDIYAIGMTLIRTLSSDEKMPNITDRFIDDTEFQDAIDTLWVKDDFSQIIHKMIELNYKDRFQRLEEIEMLLENKIIKNISKESSIEKKIPQKESKSKKKTAINLDKKTGKKPLGILSTITLLGILSVIGYTTYPLIEKGFSKYNIFQDRNKEEKKSHTIIKDEVINEVKEKEPSTPTSSLPTKDELQKDIIENNNSIEDEFNEPTPICTSQNVKLFLNEFIAISESNDLNNILSFYSPKVTKYFNLKNVSHKEILADKKKYLKRWPHRNFKLISFSIDDNYIEDDIEYCEITRKTRWSVYSKNSKKSGTSTSKMVLVNKNKNSFKVKAVYTVNNKIDPEKKEIKKEPVKTTPKSTPKPKISTKRVQHSEQEELILTGNKLLLMVKYPKHVKKNEKIIINVKLINTGVTSYLTGGASISFPGFKNLNIKKLSNNFTTFRKYDSKSKIFHRTTHKTFTPRNLLLESTKHTWKKNEEHSLSFEIIPYQGIHRIQLLVRGALNSSRLVPAQGSVDQQGYPARSITIKID